MLTKSDIKAIKDLLKGFATKEDLKGLLTKEDGKNFATKDDLKNFATKDDLIGLARGTEIDDLKITFEDNISKWKSELFDKIDKVLGRVITAEEENAILKAHAEGRLEATEGLEKRVSDLEKILKSS